MKKKLAVILFSMFFVSGAWAQSVLKIGETLVSSTQTEAEAYMKKLGLNPKLSKSRVALLDNDMCDVVSGNSEKISLCHAYFWKERPKAEVAVVVKMFPNNNAMLADLGSDPGWMKMEEDNANRKLILVKESGTGISYLAVVKVENVPGGGVSVRVEMAKMKTPK